MVRVSATVALACSLAVFARPLGIPEVEADIADISTRVNNLDSSINNFPDSGGSLSAALGIHNAAVSLESSINQATSDVMTTGSFDEADANTILASIEAIEPTIIDALQKIVTKKPAFDALPLGGVSGLVKQDLNILNTNTTSLENALIAAAPDDLKDEATAIKTALDAAFSTAIAGYA